MNYCNPMIEFLGTNFESEIQFTYNPGEKATMECPGEPPELIIHDIQVKDGDVWYDVFEAIGAFGDKPFEALEEILMHMKEEWH